MNDEQHSAVSLNHKTTDELVEEYIARRQSHLRAVAASEATPHNVSLACLLPVTNPSPQTALWAQQRVECMQLQRLHHQQQQQALEQRLQQQDGVPQQQTPILATHVSSNPSSSTLTGQA